MGIAIDEPHTESGNDDGNHSPKHVTIERAIVRLECGIYMAIEEC